MESNGDVFPWVNTAKHLGNHLSSKLNFSSFAPETKTDLLVKRAILFDRIHQVIQHFGYFDPRLVIHLLSVYSTALYGSNLWEINCEEYLKLVRSWNTAVKMIWYLPHPTHRRYLESLSPVPHLESTLTGRYIGFVDSLAKSKKPLLKLLFSLCGSNLGSQTGQNIKFLLQKNDKYSLVELVNDRNQIKKSRVYPLSENENWKISLIEELALVKKGQLENGLDETSIDDILDYVCTD